jgi:2-dehydropantoate 2-reductase
LTRARADHRSVVAVVGPGAIGATLAAALQSAGRDDVVLCARRAPGSITVESDDHALVTLDVPVLTDVAQLPGSARWVLLSVKAHQTVGAAPWLAALCDDRTTVVVLQNGVEHRARVEPLVGAANVLPATVWSASEMVRPGHVRAFGVPVIKVPDEPAGRDFAELFDSSSVEVELLVDFRSDAWLKLIFNAVAGLEALAGRRAGMFRIPEVRELGRRYAAESALVARADGAVLADDVDEHVMARLAANDPQSGTSILYDRIADRQLEWDARNEVVRRIGARHGIPTPISAVVVPLLIAASNEP